MLKEILLEIGFIKEIRTTVLEVIKVPQTFFHNFTYSQKYDLVHLTPYHRQPCILQFCYITKGVPVLAKFSDLIRLLTAIPVDKLSVLDLTCNTVLLRYFVIADLRLTWSQYVLLFYCLWTSNTFVLWAAAHVLVCEA